MNMVWEVKETLEKIYLKHSEAFTLLVSKEKRHYAYHIIDCFCEIQTFR